jgi:hypothetical protein
VSFLAHRSVLTLLISAVLAIGGCLPCQQLFAGEPSQKSCCNSKGECQRPNPETPSKKTCDLKLTDAQSEPQQQSDRLVAGSLADSGEPVADCAPVAYSPSEVPSARSTDSSPPPLFLLNLCLLI